ncbi:hypothetical protein EJ08DRAFT_736994 [Tothia fuscella]|uniref:F-box domain-containing protein n=1 Tax=Tothia fuscella TaxID=1048955 RepID=A0A9P4NKC8_9PEZI|nr:hypothetical protein EJ08DRAFT_736994 [Tothia fuscella]
MPSHIPNEITTMIAEKIDVQDDIDVLYNFRLANRTFAACASKPCQDLFQHIVILLHPRSLRRLRDIISSPALCDAVLKISISTRCYPQPHELVAAGIDPHLVKDLKKLSVEQRDFWMLSDFSNDSYGPLACEISEILQNFTKCHALGLTDRTGMFFHKKHDDYCNDDCLAWFPEGNLGGLLGLT